MKKVISGIVAVLLICSLAGCAKTKPAQTQDSKKNEVTATSSFSESNKTNPPETEEPQVSESQTTDKSSPETIISEETSPSIQPKESDSGSKTQEPAKTEPTETKKETPKETTSPHQEKPKEPSTTKTQETEQPSSPSVTPPKQEETAPAKEPETKPQEPKETEPTFDINNWIEFAKNYARSVGLVLNPDATSCWDNPIGAGAHCRYLERDIKDCLNCYSRDDDVTDVWIWAVPTGNNCYDLMIGYA